MIPLLIFPATRRRSYAFYMVAAGESARRDGGRDGVFYYFARGIAKECAEQSKQHGRRYKVLLCEEKYAYAGKRVYISRCYGSVAYVVYGEEAFFKV